MVILAAVALLLLGRFAFPLLALVSSVEDVAMGLGFGLLEAGINRAFNRGAR